MTAYRFTAEEFLFLAQRLGLTHIPRWCPAACSSSEEALLSSLTQKGFLLSDLFCTKLYGQHKKDLYGSR